MKKNKSIYVWVLTAALTVALSGSMISCSDDDDNNNENKTEQGGDSQKGMSELQDDQLRDLICQWCDVQKDELVGTEWKSKTFEPTVGFLADESAPYDRSVVVGTIEQADLYAVNALGTLGIDFQSPDGFSYNDEQVGNISYHHASADNILAYIDVQVKQLPQLKRIYLTIQGDENANDKPYYHCGDVIKYKNRYYVCASDHKYGEKALFVTFNNHADQETGTFGWSGVGEDVVYKNDQAFPETLRAWLGNIVCNKQKREGLRGELVDYGLSEEEINQVVPATEDQTFMFLNSISDEYHMLVNTAGSGSATAASAMTWQVLKESQGDPMESGFDPKDKKNIQRLLITPAGVLLTKKVRWRVNFTSSWDQWVPYIFLVKDSKYAQLKSDLDGVPCINTLSKKHFEWENVGTVYVDQTLTKPADVKLKAPVEAGTYHVLVLAIYWQHEIVKIQGYPTQMLFDYTKDFAQSNYGNKTDFQKPSRYWYRRPITSSQITFTDKGKAQSKYAIINPKN